MDIQILEKLDRIEKTITSGELKVSKVAGKLLFKKEWVDKWLNNY